MYVRYGTYDRRGYVNMIAYALLGTVLTHLISPPTASVPESVGNLYYPGNMTNRIVDTPHKNILGPKKWWLVLTSEGSPHPLLKYHVL